MGFSWRQPCRRTSAASSRDARYAGSPPAAPATQAKTKAAPNRVLVSLESRPYRSDATNRDAHALTTAPVHSEFQNS
jgi:hypothetical protein